MSEPLDRPVWNALTTRQSHLAVESGVAVRIDPAYGPFAAARDTSDEAQAALAATLCGIEDRIGVVEREAWPVPPGLRVLGGGDLVQMLFEGPAPDASDDPRIELLRDEDAPGPTPPNRDHGAARRTFTAITMAFASTGGSPRWRASG